MPATNTTALEALKKIEDLLKYSMTHAETKALITAQKAIAALESSAPSAAEPFAWIWQLKANPSKTGVYLENPALSGIDIDSSGYIWTKVYDHFAPPAPAPSAASEREAQALVKDIHDAIAELVPVVRYPDLTAAIDRLGELAALHSTGKPDEDRCECNARSEHECVFCAWRRQWGVSDAAPADAPVAEHVTLTDGVCDVVEIKVSERGLNFDALNTEGSTAEAVEPVAPSGMAEALLGQCLKPEEVAGTPTVRSERLRELLCWFERLAVGNANPKWLRGHAFELAYLLATRPPAPEDAKDAARKPLDKADQKWCCYGGGVPRENCDFPCAARAALSQGGGA